MTFRQFSLGFSIFAVIFSFFVLGYNALADGVAPKKPGKAPTVVTKEVVQEPDGTGFVYVLLSDGTRCIVLVEGVACDFAKR